MKQGTYLLLLLLGCLLFLMPASQAQQTVGLFLNNETASFPSYTLFGNNRITYLIDNCGYIVNTWQSNEDPGLGMYLLEDGNLLRTREVIGNGDFGGAGGLGGGVELLSWEGQRLWSYEYFNANVHAHHDIEPLPNGNFLLIAWEKHSEEEAQQMGRVHSGEVWSERIVEIEMLGNNDARIVWEWRLWDHLVQNVNPNLPNYASISEHPELVDINYINSQERNPMDWVHLNAISYHPDLDQIAVSSRNFSEIWMIDHSTTIQEAASHSGGRYGKGGDLLYRYGNPQTYQRGTEADRQFFNQHDVRWIPEGYPNEGSLMVFNNGFTRNQSSVEIWQPAMDEQGNYLLSNDSPFLPLQSNIVHSSPSFHSDIMAGAQPLPNGNLLICEANKGRLLEITPQEQIVWEYINPVNTNGGPVSQGGTPRFNYLFRATKYPINYPAFWGKNLSPQAPVEINPDILPCIINDVVSPPLSNENNIQIKNTVVQNELIIEQLPLNEEVYLKIVNTLGQTIQTHLISSLSNEYLLRLDGLEKGIYYLIFQTSNNKPIVYPILKH